MTHEERLKVEAKDGDISVTMRGTCFRVRYHVQGQHWLIATECGPDDPDAVISIFDFRKIAFEAASKKAQELGWIV